MRRGSPRRRRGAGAAAGRRARPGICSTRRERPGRPKGVIYTFRMALANYVNIGGAIGLASSDTTASFLPFFHTAGINLHALPTLIAGGRVIVLDGFDADRLVALLEARRLDTVFAVPTVYQSLLDHPRFAAAPLDARPPLGLRRRADARRARSGLPRARRPRLQRHGDDRDRPDRLPGRPGRRLGADRLGRQAAIAVLARGSSTAPAAKLPDGEVGDLQFAGPGVTPGYWRNEEATRAAFTERRLADLGRPRPARRRRLLLDRRAAQGDVHLGRRERLSGRGRERALGPSGDRRCGGARRGGPEMGRGRPRLRPARAGRRRARPAPSSRPSAAPASPPTRCRAASTSSPNSRAPRPARSRSICSSEAKCGGLETDGTHEPAATGSDQKHPAKFRLAHNGLFVLGGGLRVLLVSEPDAALARLAIRRIISSARAPRALLTR